MRIVKYSLVIPVFKNESNVESLFSVLHVLNTSLNEELEVVFVIDGSPDRSLELITQRLQPRSSDLELSNYREILDRLPQ